MTKTDLEWSQRWRGELLQTLKENGGELLDLLNFVTAVCRRKGLGAEIVDKEKAKKFYEKKARTILAFDVAPLIKQSLAKSSDDELWMDFVITVFRGVDRIVQDHARPITFAPEVPLGNIEDSVPSVEEAYEREQAEKEELLPTSEAKVICKVAVTMDSIYATINERVLVAKLPIYSLMKKYPRRYGFLWGLFVALWPEVELFEALTEAYAGESVKVPVKTDYKKAERVRQVLHLRSTGLTQEEIAVQLHMKQPRVHQLLKEWAATRRPEYEKEKAMLKALNKGLNCLMKAKVAHEIHSL